MLKGDEGEKGADVDLSELAEEVLAVFLALDTADVVDFFEPLKGGFTAVGVEPRVLRKVAAEARAACDGEHHALLRSRELALIKTA